MEDRDGRGVLDRQELEVPGPQPIDQIGIDQAGGDQGGVERVVLEALEIDRLLPRLGNVVVFEHAARGRAHSGARRPDDDPFADKVAKRRELPIAAHDDVEHLAVERSHRDELLETAGAALEDGQIHLPGTQHLLVVERAFGHQDFDRTPDPFLEVRRQHRAEFVVEAAAECRREADPRR